MCSMFLQSDNVTGTVHFVFGIIVVLLQIANVSIQRTDLCYILCKNTFSNFVYTAPDLHLPL